MADIDETTPHIDPSSLSRDELIKMIDEEERSYPRRLIDMCKGLGQPKDSLDYKKAMIELQRLGAPIGAILILALSLIAMSLMKITAEEKPPVVVTELVQAEETEQLEEPPEEPPEPPEEIPEMEEFVETDVVVDIDAPPTTSAVQSPSPAPVDAVSITPSPKVMVGVYASRSSGTRGAAIGRYGVKTEQYVYGFLRYLKKTQGPNGMWDANRKEVSTGATALALLCFLAHGELPGQSAEFGDTVEKAIRGLIDDQIKSEAEIDHRDAPRKGGTHAWRRGEIGYFKGRDTCNYAHLIAVYALSEAYAMTRIPDVKAAVERALPHIINGQNAQGGWYYNMDASCPVIDTSYASWAVQALKAAKLAHVGDSKAIVTALKKASRGIKALSHPDGSFGYTNKNKNEERLYPGLTAPCALILQMLDESDTELCRKSIQYMSSWEPTFKRNFTASRSGAVPMKGASPQYYCYYLSQVRFNLGDNHPSWKAWNAQQQAIYSAAAINIPAEKSGYKDQDGKPQYITFWPRKGGKHRFGGEASAIPDEQRLAQQSGTRNGMRGRWPVADLVNGDAATSEWQGAASDIISSCFTALQLMVYYRNSPLSKGALTAIEEETEVKVDEGGGNEVELDFGDL